MNQDQADKWAEFLLQRQKRKLLLQQNKANDKDNNDKISKSSPKSLQRTQLQNKHNGKIGKPLTSNIIHNNHTNFNDNNNDNLNDNNTDNDNNNNNNEWINLYEDVLYHISSFCTFSELENITFCCKTWYKYVTYTNENKWKLWYKSLNIKIQSITSLDRTGTSNHFIITQNSYDSYDSITHFAKFAEFASCNLLQFKSFQNNNNNININDYNIDADDIDTFKSLYKLNNHSPSITALFTNKIASNIIFEYKKSCIAIDEKKIDHNINTSTKTITTATVTQTPTTATPTLSIANPEMIYINNSYDTSSDNDDDNSSYQSIDITDYYTTEDEDDDNNDNNNAINNNLIRNNIKYIIKTYKYFLFCIKNRNYLDLLYLFENIILIESRPILRYFLFVLDRSKCFGKKILKYKKYKNIGDMLTFLKYLENYIRQIHSVLNMKKLQIQLQSIQNMNSKFNISSKNTSNTSNTKNINPKYLYYSLHQQYLLKMCVDIDEIRARGVSSLQYWMKSGTMICNPDL